MLYLYQMITVLKVDDDGHVQVFVSCCKRQWAPCHAVAHPSVLRQGFTQMSSGFWMLAPEQNIPRVTTEWQQQHKELSLSNYKGQ